MDSPQIFEERGNRESHFGVPEGTAVFALSMDLFDFYFIKDHGHYRVVTPGLDEASPLDHARLVGTNFSHKEHKNQQKPIELFVP